MTEKTFYLFWQKQLHRSQLFRFLTIFFAIYAALFFIVLGIVFLAVPETRAVAVVALLAFLISKFLVCDFLALIIHHPRPYQALNFTPVIFSRIFSLKTKVARSFPSGHVMSIAAISTVLFAYDVSLGIAGFIIAAFAGAARVIMGYHYPVDVIVGFILGVLVGLLTLLI